MDIMYYMAAQLMQHNQPFILENNFENISKEPLIKILEEYSYTAITVTLTGNYQKIYQRFAERNGSPDRHRGHVIEMARDAIGLKGIDMEDDKKMFPEPSERETAIRKA